MPGCRSGADRRVVGCRGPLRPALGARGRRVAAARAYDAVLGVMDDYPLVALGEFHLCQQHHEFLQALLVRPAPPAKLDDIVVEFGNALYQDVADRFVARPRPGHRRRTLADLAQHDRRADLLVRPGIRTVLPYRARGEPGTPTVGPHPRPAWRPCRSIWRDPQLRRPRPDASTGRTRHVLHRRRRTGGAGPGTSRPLIAGADHTRRGEATNDNPTQGNLATLLSRAHPDVLFVIDPLPFNPR